ncbi:hypothetical protein BR93DRAFT_568513 [Coniochaeta sp. PMI_546]|nr:hypothetical protein BR93DRAFT_568513 [Coniochaeta sp. PMI_546]
MTSSGHPTTAARHFHMVRSVVYNSTFFFFITRLSQLVGETASGSRARQTTSFCRLFCYCTDPSRAKARSYRPQVEWLDGGRLTRHDTSSNVTVQQAKTMAQHGWRRIPRSMTTTSTTRCYSTSLVARCQTLGR